MKVINLWSSKFDISINISSININFNQLITLEFPINIAYQKKQSINNGHIQIKKIKCKYNQIDHI